MKKIISLFLALLMALSLATAVFAEGVAAPQNSVRSLEVEEGNENENNNNEANNNNEENNNNEANNNNEENNNNAENNNAENNNAENNNANQEANTQTEENQEEAEEESNGVLDTIMNFPWDGAVALAKAAKVLLKFVKVFGKLGLKVGVKTGVIDISEFVQHIAEAVGYDADAEAIGHISNAIATVI